MAVGYLWSHPPNQSDTHPCVMCAPFIGMLFPNDTSIPLPAHPACDCFYQILLDVSEDDDRWFRNFYQSWDDVPANSRHKWMVMVASLLCRGEPVPAGLTPLVDDAIIYNKERDKDCLELSSEGDFMVSPERVVLGAALASKLNDLIDDLVTDDRSRDDIIDEIVEASGDSRSVVLDILNGEINCPELSCLRGFIDVLGHEAEIVEAAEADGCKYEDVSRSPGSDVERVAVFFENIGLARCSELSQLQADDGNSLLAEYDVTMITAGLVRKMGGGFARWLVPDDVLKGALEKFGGASFFVDHLNFWVEDNYSVWKLAGVFSDPVWDDNIEIRPVDPGEAPSVRGGIRARLKVYDVDAGRRADEVMRALLDVEPRSNVGLSATFWQRSEFDEDLMLRVTKEIFAVDTCDLVFQPGANGEINERLAVVPEKDVRGHKGGAKPSLHALMNGGDMPTKNVLNSDDRVSRDAVEVGAGAEVAGSGVEVSVGAGPGVPGGAPSPPGAGSSSARARTQKVQVGVADETRATPPHFPEGANHAGGVIPPFAGQQVVYVPYIPPGYVQLAEQPVQQEALESGVSGADLQGPLQPAGSGDDAPLTRREFQEALAKLVAPTVVRGLGEPPARVITGSTSLERFSSVVDWLFGVEGAGLPDFDLRSPAMVYQYMSGDHEWRGMFDPERVKLSGATSTTLADMAANAMNKVITTQWSNLEVYRWYEQVVTIQSNDGSLHDMQWITVGGVANLPQVAEKGVYTELDISDEKEADPFVKYGGYVGISIEMLRKSQIAQIQAVPRALAVAAVRTRSGTCAAIFTDNSGVGPTLDQDSTALFHANHSNVATTAFGTDDVAWRAARTECAKHTEVGSSKRLGIFPRFWLGPVDLYDQALETFGYGGGLTNTIQPEHQGRGLADPRPIPLAIPEWTDTNDWAYLVDPAIFPVIMISYADAPNTTTHPQPMLFSVGSPTAGLMFTNDVLPIKVRDHWAMGVNGYRGIGKRNVA